MTSMTERYIRFVSQPLEDGLFLTLYRTQEGQHLNILSRMYLDEPYHGFVDTARTEGLPIGVILQEFNKRCVTEKIISVGARELL